MKYACYFIDVDSRTMELHIQSLWVNLVLFVSFSCHSGHDVDPHTNKLMTDARFKGMKVVASLIGHTDYV